MDRKSLEKSVTGIENAYKSFFSGGGYPKFKSKRLSGSFTSGQTNSIQNGTISISRIKNIPIVISRTFEGKIKTVTITKTPTGKYFASVLVESGYALPSKPSSTAAGTIGIDLGLTHFAILDNGTKIDNPRFLKSSIERLKVLQRRASKKKKGSANRKKANLKVAILHEKITNKRTDFLHKLSHKLTHDNQVDTICIEDLNVKGMIQNHKLAQSISDASWSEFTRQLKYKCDWYGKNLIQIGRFEPSTKTCSNCGELNKTLTLKDREWVCAGCGSIHDRDVNAAKNIKSKNFSGKALPSASAEPTTIVGAVKQEF